MVYEENQNAVHIATNRPNITIGTSDGHFFTIDLYKKKITIKHLLRESKEFEVMQEGADNNENRKLRLEAIDKAFEELAIRDLSLDEIKRINRTIYALLTHNGTIDRNANNFIQNIDSLLRNEFNAEFRQYDMFFLISGVFHNYWKTELRAKFIEQLNIKD